MSLTERMARIICEDPFNHGECEKCGVAMEGPKDEKAV